MKKSTVHSPQSTVLLILASLLLGVFALNAAPHRATLRKNKKAPQPTLVEPQPTDTFFGTDISTATPTYQPGDTIEWRTYVFTNGLSYQFVYQGDSIYPTTQIFNWTANFCCGVQESWDTYPIPLNPDGTEQYTLTVYQVQ